jgi:NitT/TauT family transport system ATP-binding protein
MRSRNELSTSSPLIEFKDVAKKYKSAAGEITTVFEDINLTINSGEFFCVIGSSGCGKSTLLNAIAGFVASTSGKTLVRGKDIPGPGSDRGCVFQEYSLFPWLTVGQNVEFGLKSKRLLRSDRMALVKEYLKLVGLEHAKEKYPFELSGGMQQRVGIARALVNKPDILLMDEPFAALDAITRNRLQQEVLTLWLKSNTTIFYITHNIEEAVFLGTRVAVMSSQPSRIAKIVEIDIEHPRERTSDKFNQRYKELEVELYEHIGQPGLQTAEEVEKN